jgi:hypothetical protein
MGASASNSSGMPPELIDAYKKGWSPVFIVPGQYGENAKYVTFKGSTPVEAPSEKELLKAYKQAKGTRRVPLPGRQSTRTQNTQRAQAPLPPINSGRNLNDYRSKRGPYNPQVLAAAEALYKAQQEVPHDDSKLDGAEAMLDKLKKRYQIDKRDKRAEELVVRRIAEGDSTLGPKIANTNNTDSQVQEPATKVGIRKNASNRYMGRGPYNPQVMAAAKAYYNAKHSSRFNSGLIGQAKKELDTIKRVHGVPLSNTRAEDRVEREAVRSRTTEAFSRTGKRVGSALGSAATGVGSALGSAASGVGSAVGSATGYIKKSGFPFSFSRTRRATPVPRSGSAAAAAAAAATSTTSDNTGTISNNRRAVGEARRDEWLARQETLEDRLRRIRSR